jgi:hypothetical protein
MKLRTTIFACAATLAALVSLGVPTLAGAAPAEPSWSLEVTGFPTNFEPGTTGTALVPPGYFIVATNIGSAPTNGSFTVTDALPAGVLPKSASGYFGRLKSSLSCSIAGQQVTCTGSGAVQSDEVVVVQIGVKVPVILEGAEVQDQATIAGGGAASARSGELRTKVTTELPGFDFLPGRPGAFVQATRQDGSPSRRAGEHPYQLTVGLGLPTYTAPNGKETLSVAGGPKDIEVTLPPGVVANPQAATKCQQSELEEPLSPTSGCPLGSQVGLIVPTLGVGLITTKPNPLYNMQSAPGSPAEFAFEILEGIYVHLQGHLRNDGQYVLAASSNDLFAKVPVYGVSTVLWSDPSDDSHDASRGYCIEAQFITPSCAVPSAEKRDSAFLTQPSACSAPPTTAFRTDSWVEPGDFKTREAEMSGVEGQPFGIEGCAELGFEPSIGLNPDTTAADSPAGLGVDLNVPQREGFDERASATLKGAKVQLPPGFVVNPSAANGRGACGPAQIGLESSPGQTPARFSESSPECPDNSKVGEIQIKTPLLEKELKGAVYLAEPFENPFGTLLALYIVVDDPETGIVLKLAGKVEPDSSTGQLTTSFEENPQLPFEDFRLNFFGGARGTLRTPQVCGTSESRSELAPWSGTAPVALMNQFSVDRGANDSPCVASQSQLPNHFAFSAGTVTPLAGHYSPFVLHLKRDDGSQELSAVNVSLPLGLTGKLAGIPYCSDSALADAEKKAGRAEQANPSCPVASEVGTVEVGAGAGPQPYYTSGKAYLAGPYRGAPLSLAVITPAVAGPFDLGTVVVRAAAYVDLETAQITVKSDPLPTILRGIPLDVRSITFNVDRPNFTLNPTSCEPAVLAAVAVSTTGNGAHLSNQFHVGNCAALRFKPNVKLSLKGSTRRTGHPALRAEVTYPKQGEYANIARAQVSLPHSEFLDQGNIGKACTKPVVTAGGCPAKSIYGKAKAWTPLLDKPLEGPVYLVGGYGYKLPALVAELNGQIRVLLKGKVDTGKNHGIRNTFEAVPDAPVSKFVLEMKGGKNYGLLENSANLCKEPQRANARFIAQNGRRVTLRPAIANDCKKHAHKSNKKKQKG